jgi:hypothetical protein
MMRNDLLKPARALALLVACAAAGGAAMALRSTAFADPPPNDDFPGTTIAALPFTDTVNTAGATDQPGEPFCGPNEGLAVWYTLTAPSDAILKAELVGSDQGVFVNVWTGSSLADLDCVADGTFHAASPSEPALSQPAVFHATANTTYYFQAGSGLLPAEAGNLKLTITAGAPPANDDFPGITISQLPFVHAVDTTFATFEVDEFSVIGPTVWYNYTPTEDIELWADTLESDFRAHISLQDFRGHSPSGVDQEYWECEILDQGLFYRAKAGETIYFQIGAMPIGGTGSVVFRVEQYGPGSPELICYGRLGPPYEGYGGDGEDRGDEGYRGELGYDGDTDIGDVPMEGFPTGGGSPPSQDRSPWVAPVAGGALLTLALAVLGAGLRGRAQK